MTNLQVLLQQPSRILTGAAQAIAAAVLRCVALVIFLLVALLTRCTGSFTCCTRQYGQSSWMRRSPAELLLAALPFIGSTLLWCIDLDVVDEFLSSIKALQVIYQQFQRTCAEAG